MPRFRGALYHTADNQQPKKFKTIFTSLFRSLRLVASPIIVAIAGEEAAARLPGNLTARRKQ